MSTHSEDQLYEALAAQFLGFGMKSENNSGDRCATYFWHIRN